VGLLTDKEMIGILCSMSPTANITEINKHVINFFRLLSGPNIRKMRQLFESITHPDQLEQQILPYDHRDSRAMRAMEELGPLIDRTYDELIRKNNLIMKNITNDITLKKATEIDWKTIEPLNRDEITRIIKTLKEESINVEIYDYFRLIDSNWFTADADLSALYPQVPFHLIIRKLAPKPSLVNTFVKNFASGLKESVNNSGSTAISHFSKLVGLQRLHICSEPEEPFVKSPIGCTSVEVIKAKAEFFE